MFEEYSDILSLEELCKALDLSRNTAKKLINSGELKAMKIGRVYKIPKINLIAYVESKCEENN